MIIGIGTDIVTVGRIRKLLLNDNFKERVFTEDEIKYCDSKKDPAVHYAGRFAAKEAFIKAVGKKKDLKSIEVQISLNGRPIIATTSVGNNIYDSIPCLGGRYHLSISHEKAYATAVVILEVT